MDKNLSTLLKWSIENSTASPGAGGDGNPTTATSSTTPGPESSNQPASSSTNGTTSSTRGLDQSVIQALLGGPSDADLMRAAMEMITSPDPDIDIEQRLVAFDNFEQLIEGIDNANNLAALSLWTPLLECLGHDHKDMRRMAAWCVGTAVQNNVKSQERLLAMGGIPTLVGMATDESQPADVKKKVLYAISSACRNYQPALDVCTEEMGKNGLNQGKVDATNMEEVDGVISTLRG